MPGLLRVWLTVIALALSYVAANATILSDDFKLEKLEHGRKASANADYRRGHTAFKRGKVFKAIEWFRKAADAGDVKAQTNLGILYLFGYSLLEDGAQIENSDTLALKYLGMAAEQGDAAAYHRIGYMHDPQVGGNADPVSMEEAIKWYRKAAELGYAPAKEDLAGIFTSDMAWNLEEALKWTEWKAAYKGDAEAQYFLASLYWRASNFEEGVGKSGASVEHLVTALKWLTIVRANTDKALVKALEGENSYLFDSIVKEMKDPKIGEARILARTCMDSNFKNCKTPGPGPGEGDLATGDWHAVAGAFKTKGEAYVRKKSLGSGWIVMNTSECPNFTKGYWIATAGPFTKDEAKAYALKAHKHGAYAKSCH